MTRQFHNKLLFLVEKFLFSSIYNFIKTNSFKGGLEWNLCVESTLLTSLFTSFIFSFELLPKIYFIVELLYSIFPEIQTHFRSFKFWCFERWSAVTPYLPICLSKNNYIWSIIATESEKFEHISWNMLEFSNEIYRIWFPANENPEFSPKNNNKISFHDGNRSWFDVSK